MHSEASKAFWRPIYAQMLYVICPPSPALATRDDDDVYVGGTITNNRKEPNGNDGRNDRASLSS